MFCPRCAFRLPDEIGFCVQCGTPVTPPASLPKRLFCVECGSSYDASWKFCNTCGKCLMATPLPDAPPTGHPQFVSPEESTRPPHIDSAEPPAVVEFPPPTPDFGVEMTGTEALHMEQTAVSAQLPEQSVVIPDPPYARFAAINLALSLCLSVLTFCVADDVARDHFYFGVLIFASVVLGLILIWPIRSLNRDLKQMGQTHHEFVLGRQRLRSRSIYFGALFMSVAGLIGFLIGKSGAETEKLVADYQRFATVGEEIGRLRNSAELTVPAQLVMYDKLEPTLKEFRAVALQVKSELGPYDEKYPASHQATQKWINDMDVAIRRGELIQKQIEAAKAIESVQPSQQYGAWRSQMQPLLEEEKALDN